VGESRRKRRVGGGGEWEKEGGRESGGKRRGGEWEIVEDERVNVREMREGGPRRERLIITFTQFSQLQILRLYAQYRQAEVHRKGLVFQKHYLQCHLDAFYQTQQVALLMLADMGCVVSHEASFPPPSKFPRPYARFRAAGAAVRAVFRFQYMCRRKREYLQSKSDKLDPAGKTTSSEGQILISSSLPRVTFSAPLASELGQSNSRTSSSTVHKATGIPTSVSNIGIRSMSLSHSGARMAPISSNHSFSKHREVPGSASRSIPGRKQRQEAHPVSSKPSSHSTKGVKKGTLADTGRGTSKPSTSPEAQLYMEGLDPRYRLSNTKPPPHTVL
jgi:hypothetical protein